MASRANADCSHPVHQQLDDGHNGDGHDGQLLQHRGRKIDHPVQCTSGAVGIGLDSRDETAQVDGGQYGHRREQHGGDGVDQIAEIVDAARCDVLDDRVAVVPDTSSLIGRASGDALESSSPDVALSSDRSSPFLC